MRTSSRRLKGCVHAAALALACAAGWSGPVARAEDPDATPELDRSLVLGDVYCDDDGDGRRGAGEVGIGGVRVVGDHGYEVDTDRDGRFHLKAFRPGVHLVKIDHTTLPPGFAASQTERAMRTLSPGLPVRVGFPVRCAFRTVGPATVVGPGDEGAVAVAPSAAEALPVVTVTGRVDPPEVWVQGRPLAHAKASLALLGQGGEPLEAPPNLRWWAGPLESPLRFRLGGGADGERARWRLVVARVEERGERPVREFSGTGVPPAELSWDGTGPAGALSVLTRGERYRARLVVTDGGGVRASSAPVSFGVHYGSRDAGVLGRLVLDGDLFGADGKPTRKLLDGARSLRSLLARHPKSRLVIEVHTDDQGVAVSELSRTRKAAWVASEAVARALRLPRQRVLGLGFGPYQPRVPNISDRNRALNRRVELVVLDAVKTEERVDLPREDPRPRARVQRLEATLGAGGRFLRSVARPADGHLLVQLTARGGATWEAWVDLGALPDTPVEAAAEDPLRRFGGRPLRQALGDPLILSHPNPTRAPSPSEVTAGDLVVRLPASRDPYDWPRAFVSGRTHPRNTLTINGRPAALDGDGGFGELVDLSEGQDVIEVVATDPTGHRASVREPVSVSRSAFFLLALADGAAGELDAHLPERATYDEHSLGDYFIEGRGVLHFRGRVPGGKLARHVFLSAQVDSARRAEFESFYDQLIDPAREYPLFGDASDDDQTIRARGPLWVLVEADRSKLQIGNIRTGFEGLTLLRYDRGLYGALARLEHAWRPGWDTRIEGFASDDARHLEARHDELRATGGSLYYLSRQELLPGSERLEVVVREQDTRLELARTSLVRDVDYRIDYTDGRVVLKAPLSATEAARSTFGRFQPFTGRQVLDGHEVWLVATYESRKAEDSDDPGERAFGAHASQRIADHLEVGGGVAREMRDGAPDYTLWGAEAAVDVVAGTRISGEMARSEGTSMGARVSGDGGLRFGTLAGELSGDEGYAWRAGLDADIGAMTGDRTDLRLRGWYQRVDEGFQAVGREQDRGTERYGGELAWRPGRRDRLSVRYDWSALRLPGTTAAGEERDVDRVLYAGRWQHDFGRVALSLDGGYGQHRDDEDGVTHDTGGAVVGSRIRLTARLDAELAQEVLVGGDDAVLGESRYGRMTTRAGLRYRMADGLDLGVQGAMRWDGDSALEVGVRRRVSDDTHMYLEERLGPGEDAEGLVHSQVVGAESRLAGGGRAFGEYRLEEGVGARQNRALVGISKRVELAPGVALSGSFEHSQTQGGPEGRTSREVASGGLEVLAIDGVRLGGRYEVRHDRAPEANEGAGREIIQALISNALDLRLTDGLSALLTVDYAMTQNLTTRDMERQSTEATLALIDRPSSWHGLTLVARVSHARRQRLIPQILLGLGQLTTRSDTRVEVASLAAIIRLPWRLELTLKTAFRWLRERTETPEELPPEPDRTLRDLLVLGRLAFHIVRGLDVAIEGRTFMALAQSEAGVGALAEVGWTLADHLRLAVGYDFSDLPRELFRDGDADAGRGGAYLRMTGAY
ncbi:MAG: hypothetical protein H6744_02450 [Deltaproteobacteria bacterium]|nr:hypothetical protein [Deltaproteobacteria bacterium]MCB9785532.1 hypothetical protein [Deltaproteobacteria bacterium]